MDTPGTLRIDTLVHLREQKEAALEATCREAQGLMQALHQNQARQHALHGQLALLDELQAAAATPPPQGQDPAG